jgi:hypothetical protein
MTTRYRYIICTYACPLAYWSVNGEISCIHYLPMVSEYVIAGPRNNTSEERVSGAPAIPDLFPIVAWQPGYDASDARNGVICQAPTGCTSVIPEQ